MAGFSEWSNKKKAERETSGVQPSGTGAPQTASSGAKSFSEWSNQKHGITAPQTYRSRNTAFENSGLTRDEFDSSVRQNYAARAAASSETDKLSESEFNRSSAMQEKYGSYANYKLGATADGKYYSQPESMGSDMDRLYNTYSTYEAALKPKTEVVQNANKELERLQGELTTQGAKLEQLYSFAQSDSSGIAGAIFEQAKQEYSDLIAQMETAATTADSAYQEYEPLYNKYVDAAEKFESYRTEQQAMFDSWKSTIRSEGDVQTDIDGMDAQISALEEQQKALNREATQLMSKVSSRSVGTQQMMELSQQAADKRNQANALQGQIDELNASRALLQEEYDWSKYYSFTDLTGNEDYADKSGYVSTENGQKRSALDIMLDNYSDSGSGYDDPLYEYINGNSEAGAYITNQAGALYGGDSNPLGALFGMSTENKSESQQMTEEEVGIFNYLYATQGKEAAHAYYEYLTGDLNYRQRKEEEEYWANYAKESPVGSSVFSVVTAPMKGLSYVAQAADYLGSGTIDQNAAYNRFSYANNAIRNQVSQTIEESGNWGKVGSFAYNTGMSMADFLLNTAISGGFSGGGAISEAMALGIMGTGAAADATIAAKDRGLTDDQSFALGTIAGAAEILTEKLSIDALLKGKWEQSAVKYILKNTLTEGSEEVGSDVINLMADVLIAKDQSEWQESIDAYMEQGKSEGEAFGLALADQAAQMGLDFLGGALSGGVMSGTGAGIGTMQLNANYKKTGETLRKFGDETMQAIIDTGLQMDETTQAHKLAAEMQQKLANGKTVSDAEIGKLFAVTSKTAQDARTETQEQPEGIVLPTAEEEANTQQPVTLEQQARMQQSEPVIQEPGVLPTAEQAEKQQRMAAAKTELERSAIENDVGEDTLGRVQRISQIVGRNVVFYSAADNSNGYYDGKTGTLYVNAQSTNPVAQIISHELTHSIEQTGNYNAFQSLILNRIQQTGGNIEQLRKDKAALYARNGHELKTSAEIDQEIVAEYVEKNLLTDEASIRAVVQQDRTLGQRILNWLNELLAKMGNADAQERAFLTQARNRYSDALKESQSSFTAETAAGAQPNEQANTLANTQETREAEGETADSTENDEYLLALRDQLANGDITEEEYDKLFEEYYDGGSETEFSFGGANANGADLEALRKAQQMQQQGVADDIIFKTTGWFAGADGKWRFEMDDSGMQYSRWGDMNREDRAEYQRFRELEMKFIDGSITLDEQNELRQLIDEGHGSGRAEEQGTQELGDFIQHDELFRNYPQLRKARMNFADLEGNTMGAYNPDTNRITLDTSLRGEAENTLVHEIQHAVQKAEGFARGSSPESWAENTGSTQRAAAVERIQGEISVLEDMLDSGTEEESEDLIRADIEDLKETLDRINYHLYQNTAGEVEARDAASRRTLTAEQRRERMPNTGDENTVFAEDDGEDLQAIGRTTDDKPFVTVEDDILAGLPEADWIDTVRENLKTKFPNGVTVGNSDIKIDGQSRREMTFSGYMQWLYNNDPQLHADKLRATDNADEILKATTGWVDEGLNHPRKDRIVDFARGNVLLRVGGNDYTADVVVGTRKNGSMVLYDVLNLQPTSFTKRETGAAKSTNPSPGAARSTAQVSGDIIRGGNENVNGLPVKKQFSLSEPVEQTETLLALHNMDEEKIRRTLNLGAWPSPSIAIVEAAQGHSNYGEYSAVFPRSVIDPEADSRNKVYGSDAWTPTWRNAQIEYEVNYDKKSALERKIAELSKNVANGIFSRGSVISSRVDDTSGMDAKALAERLAGDDTVRAAYLAETGGTLKPVLKSKEWNKYGNGVLQTLIDEIGVQELARINVEMEAGEDRIAPAKGVEDTVRQILRDDYEQKFRNVLDRKPESKQKRLDNYIENNVSIFTVESIVRDAWRMYEDGGATKGEIDRNATQDELREATNEEDVAAWLLGQMDGLLGEPGIYNNKEPYTASGNRRSFKALHYDYNAENIVRAMNEAAERGEGYWGAGAEGMMAMATPEYANVDEMHADEARLYTETEEQRKERFAKLDDEIMQIISEVKRTTKAHSDSSYQESDIVGGILMQTATEQKTEKGVKRAFAKEGYAISDVLAKRIADMYREAAQIPTGYFEAKPQRVVDFDEELAVLAPTDAPAELVAALRNAGMNVMEYNAGDEQSRLEVINSIDGAKFSISEDGDRYNGTAVLEEETIDKYLKDYAAPSSPNYAQAYIAYISPEDFIWLTTSAGGRDLIERQSHALDMEEFKDSTRHQPLQMRIDHETGEVEGHEGRHRAAALSNAGVQRVPVLLFDSSNKYSKTAIDILTLTGQDFGNTRSNAEVDVFDVQPFSYANRETLLKKYGRQPTQERIAENYGRKTVRYSVSEDENTVPEAQLPTAEDTDVIGTLPMKAQDYLKRAERTLVSTIGNALSVPKFARREYLNGIVREISTEYLENGTVSQETIDRLFDTAYDEGVVVDSEFYDTYKEIKDHLRTQAITISEQDKSDIADYNDFRKSAFGTLRIVNEGGLPVDVAYMELQDMAGELFPEDITHPADQLMRMYDVARSIERSEKSLQEYYGSEAADFRSWAKNDFDAAVNDTVGELKAVKRYTDENAADAGDTELTTQEDVAEAYKQLKEARRTYEKAAAKNLLTDHDNVQVGRLLKGELELENLDPAKDNVKGITAVYEAKKEYERLMKLIREWNTRRRADLRAKADEYLRTAIDWKDKKAGALYSRETMERNVQDIVKDKALAKEIIDEYFKPVHDAQAKATKMKNTFRERVKALNLSTQETKAMQKRGQVSEAHAVQLLGEATDNIQMLENSRGRMEQRDGKTLADWRGIVQDLKAQNRQLDWKKIENAVEEFRKIYDELFKLMNESRLRNGYEPVNYRKGYFPHFQPGNGDGILSLFGKALGIDTQVAALPTTINGLTHTFKPGIQWFGNAQERLGFNTAYDAVEGFDKYIEGVADVVNQTDNIQKLRALATQMRYRTGDEGIRKQVDAVYADTSLSEQDKQNRIDKIFESGRYTLSNFVVELEEYTNLLANKKSRADRNMEQALGRNMYNIVKALESRVAANMVAVNPASWLTNFIPLTQGGAMLDRGQLLKGMWQTLQAYKTDDGIVDASTFLTNRRGSDPLVKTWAQKASAAMSSPMEYIDQFTADSLVRARYNQNLKKGLSESAAMSEADSWAAGVMADRSKGSMPTLFNRSNPLTKVFTQFQLEVNNQLSYVFKDMPRGLREKGLGALALALFKFCLGAWLYDEVYEYFIGRRPALDPIGILNDTVGDITGYELPNLVELGVGAVSGDMPSFETEKKNAYDTVSGLAGTVAEELPFIGGVLGGGRVPISSALPDWDNLLKTVTSDTWSSEKKWATAAKELGNPLTYLALPFGGGQLKKIYQGLSAAIKGGSYTVDAEGNDILQYPVYNDDAWEFAKSATQATLFGKTSLKTGRDWIESGFKSFGAKETAAYQAMTEAGVPDEDAYNTLMTLRGAKKTDTESEAQQERRMLQEADISGDGKSVVYYGLMASDKERELMDAMTDMDADMGEVTNVLMGIKDAGTMTGAEASNAKRDALAQATLTDGEKQEVYRYMFGTKQDDGSYTTSRDDDIMAFEQAGMDFDTFLQAQNQYSTINEEYDSAGEKATEFSRWVNGQDFTEEEAETVKNSFTYYSQIPAAAARYDGFVGAGIADDDAYELANKINALEPLDGEDNVSDLQRYTAVTDSGLSAEDQMRAMSKLMGEAEYEKLQTGYSYGVTPSSYVKFKQLQPMYDTDGNGSFKQSEVEAALTALVASNEVRAALWQMANKSWKPQNNPFNTSVGQSVYDALNAEEPEITTTGGIVLPMY